MDSLRERGLEAIAVSLLWAFVNPVHERRIAEIIARRSPGVHTAELSVDAPETARLRAGRQR